MEGTDGALLTETPIELEGTELHPLFEAVTVYVPDAVAFKLVPVVLLLQLYVTPFTGEVTFKATLLPWQNVVAPPAVITGVEGIVLTVTTVAVDDVEHPAEVAVTVYDPEEVTFNVVLVVVLSLHK